MYNRPTSKDGTVSDPVFATVDMTGKTELSFGLSCGS